MQRQKTNWIKSGVLWKAFLGAGRDPALKPVYLRSAALLSLLLAFGLRLYRLGYQSIWWDEGYSIGISSKSLSDIVSTTATDIHPPFYYWLLHFWLPIVGKSEFSARFLSLVFGVLIVALAYRLGLRLLGHNGAFLVAFLTAISPFLITYSQETRMYTLETLLGLASVYFLAELLMRQWSPPDRQGIPSGLLWGGYELVVALALYTDYRAAIMLVFENLFVGAWALFGLVRGSTGRPYAGVGRAQEVTIHGSRNNQRAISRFILVWTLAQIVVVVLYLPWLSIAIRQVRGWGFVGVVAAPSLKIMLSQLWSAFNIGVPVHPSAFPPSNFVPYLWFGVAVLVGFIVIALLQKREAEQGDYWKEALLLCYLVIPLVAFLVVMRFRPFFHPRYMLFALPSYLLLLALALNAIWRWWRLLVALSLGVVLAGFGVGIHSYFFDPAFAKDDARSTAQFLAEEAKAEDLILWDPEYPLQYYYRGAALAEHVQISLDSTAEELQHLARGRTRVFWVTWDPHTFDLWQMVPFLLERNGRKTGEAVFSGFKVRWYELSQGPFLSVEDLQATNVNFGDKIALTGVAFGGEKEGPQVESGEACWVMLRWKCLRQLKDNLKFYVHIYDKGGRLVGQDDGLLFNGDGWKTPHWKEGDTTYSFATSQIELGAIPGDCSIEVGVYVAETLQRLSIGAVGRPDIIGSLQVLPSSIQLAVESLQIKSPLSARFGDIELLGYDQELSQVGQGDYLSVTLFWHATQQPQHDLFVVIGLTDGRGAVAEEFRLPVSASYPTSKWRSGEAIGEHYDLPIPANLPGGEWRLRIGLAAEDELVGEPVFFPPFRVIERQRSFVLPTSIQHPLKAEVGDFTTLLGYSVDKEEVRAGDKLNLTLYWRARATADKRYTVFAHLIDEGNQIWGQRDAMPQEGRAPTTSWLEGEVIVDTYQIPVGHDCPAGEYSIEVGMYDLETGKRLPVDGGDHVLLGKIRVLRP